MDDRDCSIPNYPYSTALSSGPMSSATSRLFHMAAWGCTADGSLPKLGNCCVSPWICFQSATDFIGFRNVMLTTKNFTRKLPTFNSGLRLVQSMYEVRVPVYSSKSGQARRLSYTSRIVQTISQNSAACARIRKVVRYPIIRIQEDHQGTDDTVRQCPWIKPIWSRWRRARCHSARTPLLKYACTSSFLPGQT